MKQLLFLSAAIIAITASAEPAKNIARNVDLKSTDGTILKGTYFAAAKPGPGAILFHQGNRTRQSWDDVAVQLAAAGINVLTVDSRAHGESGGTPENYFKAAWASDLELAFQYLSSQPRVNQKLIGVAGAGVLGVETAVETARRHSAEIKSLVMISGESDRSGSEFLHHASQLPELFIADDTDEYMPVQEAMKLLYVSASTSTKKLVYYSQAEEAPWLWYETFRDSGKVAAHGGHGTDMFKPHPELPGMIVHWFVTTLIKTPGHAAADTLASAAILNQLEFGGYTGIAQVKQQLLESRKKDPQAQLFPEVSAAKIGEDYQRAGDAKTALEVFKVVELAYPDSADLQTDVASAYLANGQKDMAREHAQKALTLLDSHAAPASSWSDTEQRRGEIRGDAEKILKQLATGS
ncbi:MAG TPA: tetratricopeptide repeat protein [Chthoniobacterales bacterium]